MFNAFLVEIDQLPNLSHLSFFIKWTQFFYKNLLKLGVFSRYGYTEIRKNRDPCSALHKIVGHILLVLHQQLTLTLERATKSIGEDDQ